MIFILYLSTVLLGAGTLSLRSMLFTKIFIIPRLPILLEAGTLSLGNMRLRRPYSRTLDQVFQEPRNTFGRATEPKFRTPMATICHAISSLNDGMRDITLSTLKTGSLTRCLIVVMSLLFRLHFVDFVVGPFASDPRTGVSR
jgi:hypothetical protein